LLDKIFTMIQTYTMAKITIVDLVDLIKRNIYRTGREISKNEQPGLSIY